MRKLIVTLPEDLHRAIKMRAVEQDTTIREIVTDMLKKAMESEKGGETGKK